MVEQAVQTVPVERAAQRRGQPASQQQGRESDRPPQHAGRDGPQSQRRTVSSGKTKHVKLALMALWTTTGVSTSCMQLSVWYIVSMLDLDYALIVMTYVVTLQPNCPYPFLGQTTSQRGTAKVQGQGNDEDSRPRRRHGISLLGFVE